MSRLLWYPGHELILADIVRAQGCYLYDAAGKRYVDLESGVWCASLGHAHPRIIRAIEEQQRAVAHTGFNFGSPVAEETGGELLALHGFEGGRCVFLCSGSEAVEYGVRVARMLIDRPLLMTMADSYFGAYGSAWGRSEEEWFSFDWFPCASCPHEGECDEGCERWRSIPFERISGFLFEPGSSSGLVRFPPEKLIRNIYRAVRGGGGLILVNEVTTGIGRTGRWFGYQHYDIEPDIVAMGKGLGNGYPVSATVFSPRASELLGDREIKYAQSHQNDPLGAAVAREVIRTIKEEGLIERGARMGEVLIEGLRSLAARSAAGDQVRGRGLMAGVSLGGEADSARAVRVHRALIERGFVVCLRPGAGVLRIDPPLTVAREDIEGFLGTFEDVLRNA
ncbi:MAG: aspartate aminotransferase family protein [Candidatus Krumholzibacteria bacterium]|nr:aspartate aminotransferase family protein [Candidatus Krumholzibacteria bacterium]